MQNLLAGIVGRILENKILSVFLFVVLSSLYNLTVPHVIRGMVSDLLEGNYDDGIIVYLLLLIGVWLTFALIFMAINKIVKEHMNYRIYLSLWILSMTIMVTSGIDELIYKNESDTTVQIIAYISILAILGLVWMAEYKDSLPRKQGSR